MITKTSDFCLQMQKKQRFKDAYPPWEKQKVSKMSHFRAQLKYIKLHQIENVLNFSEHTLVLILCSVNMMEAIPI